MSTNKFVSYLRVSTDKQGRSGLGLDAQRESIQRYCVECQGVLLEEVIEIESGKRDDRPKLKEALNSCRRTGATLIIAKLDRLSRNVAFIANLMESGVEFRACDFPSANRLTVHILAAMAEHEREMISIRTKEALRAARARGVKLGSPLNLTTEMATRGRAQGVAARIAKADTFAGSLYGLVVDYTNSGMSLREVARRLNSTCVLGPRGKAGSWTPTAVKHVLERGRRIPHVCARESSANRG